MLKDYLLDWCQDEIDGSITGCCSKYCDNQEHCEHDCDRCLDQVHWYPSKPGRADYTCSNLLLRYVVRFTEKYSQQIASALTFIDHSRYPRYNILSIGCGGTPDLMAFEEVNTKPIYYIITGPHFQYFSLLFQQQAGVCMPCSHSHSNIFSFQL